MPKQRAGGEGVGSEEGDSVLLRIPIIHQTEGDVFCGTTKRTMLSLPHLIIAPLPYPSGLDLPRDAAVLADRRAPRRRWESKGLVLGSVGAKARWRWEGGHYRGTCVTPTRAFLWRHSTHHDALLFFCDNTGVNLGAPDYKGSRSRQTEAAAAAATKKHENKTRPTLRRPLWDP